jgi:MazG family protein
VNYPELEKLIDVVAKLRDPASGCPWDLEQTHKSLLKYLTEESYEFIHAVEQEESSQMEEEIGDVLLQVLLHAKIASENGHFDMESVAKKLADKLIYRHPHVFKNRDESISSEEVVKNWDQLKQKEKGSDPLAQMNSELLAFPALFSSYKIGQKSKKVDFDWDNFLEVLPKVEEEWQELKQELPPHGKYNKERAAEELGDLLFSTAQLARHLDLNPEELLRDANAKFIRRFEKMVEISKDHGVNFLELSSNEKEDYWNLAKKSEKLC